MQARRRTVLWLAGAAAAVVFCLPAGAVPRYTARYEQKCALCHVNPSGGGLRATYASQKLVPDEIAWSPKKPRALAEIDPLIGKHLLVGTDFRELYIHSDVPAQTANFFEMQADVYLGFLLSPRVTLYYDRGQSDSYELFGLAYLHPTFYVKGGRFVPSYGWKFDDHTAFVRTELGLAPPANSDVGLEAGWSKGPVDVQFGLLNGSRGANPDTDTKLAQTLNVAYRFHAGPIGASIGASGYRNETPSSNIDGAGLYGYLTWKKLTWLWEVDAVRERDSGGLTESAVMSHELTWLIRQGLELKATYDAFDPDRDLGTGSKSRWGAGVFVMPWSYATFELLVRDTSFDDGVSYSGEDFTETVLQLHLLF